MLTVLAELAMLAEGAEADESTTGETHTAPPVLTWIVLTH